MDVSIQGAKPGWYRATGLRTCQWILALVLACASWLPAPLALGFSIHHIQFGNNIRLQPEDILQGGSSLGRSGEQVFGEGTLRTSLTDFSQALDVNIGGTLAGGTLTASVDRLVAVTVQLSNDERRDCLGSEDFEVSFRVVAPRRDALAATGAGGGELRVLNFVPIYRGGIGGSCPRNLFYGYRLDLGVDNAISDGDYVGITEIQVRSLVPGGGLEVAQETLEIQMPGFLLLYHYNRIDVNLEAGALAGALGASSACSGGFCMDLGRRSFRVGALDTPIAVGLSSDTGAFVPLQTITLRNAVGVRAVGCSGNRYDSATYQVLNPTGGVRSGSGVLDGIQNQPCGLDLRSGDLAFALDLTQVDPSAGRASATLQITVTGL
ncbi:MAG: hypothetical protein AB7I04_06210 [Pseudomonadales bacterium]